MGRQPRYSLSRYTIPHRLTVAGEAAAKSFTSNCSHVGQRLGPGVWSLGFWFRGLGFGVSDRMEPVQGSGSRLWSKEVEIEGRA